MDVKKIFGDIANSIKDANEVRKEKIRLQKQIEGEKRTLLEKFEFPQMKQLCNTVLGREPNPWREDRTGKKYKANLDRYDYVEFIVHEFTLEQIREFAVKRRIAPHLHTLRNVVDVNQQHAEFENIKNAVISYFKPEPITDEEHLKAQLAIFLKTRFPNTDVQREVPVKSGIMDILIDGVYAIEVKVPHNNNELRNAEGQIADYKEEFPNLWVVILDVGLIPQSTLHEYQDKYIKRYDTPSVIIQGKLRN